MTELTVDQKAALYDTIRPEIRKLAHQMEIKFRIHDKDRGNPFDCEDDKFMISRLSEEMEEFENEINNGHQPSKVWREGSDCCNFFLMRIINYEKAWRLRFNNNKVPQ